MIACIFDTETDGLITSRMASPERQPRIIEFCAKVVNCETGEFISSFNELINSGRPIPEKIKQITGIEDVSCAKRIEQYHAEISALLASSDFIVAHNLYFDKTMLELEAKRTGQAPFIDESLGQRLICTVAATHHYKGHRLKLSDLYQHLFNEGFSGAHRAEADVDALVRIFLELYKRGEIQ